MELETPILLESIQRVERVTTFFLDRYFPTSPYTDIFRTNDVLTEHKRGHKTIAPFISPRSNGVVLERYGQHMRRYTPPMIGIRRTTTVDNLSVRGFGEALYSNLTPQEREKALLLQDMAEMRDVLTRKKEAMAAEVLFSNRLTVKEYGEDGKPVGNEWDLRFYDGDVNPAIYTPIKDWDTSVESGEQIFADLAAMIKMLSRRGLPATEVILASDVADVLVNNAYIFEKLDNRRFELGTLAPQELPDGVTRLGRFLIPTVGRSLDFYCYDEEYYDEETDTFKSYVPKGHIILLAPACGHTVYGGITQMEDDRHFHTYAGIEVPRYFSNIRDNMNEIILRSAPLMLPHQESPWVVAQVLTPAQEEEPTTPITPPDEEEDETKKEGDGENENQN